MILNKTKLKVSIIIPVYNAEKFLDDCVKSALNQTYENIEVIAVNDGSTDDSLQILKKYSDKITIIDKKNGGTSTAINAGIKIMKGEWFKWLSADDILYPNAVELLVTHALQIGENAFSTIFYTNYEIIDENGQKLNDFLEPNYNLLSNFQKNVILLDHFIGNGTTSLIHKSLFEKFGFFDEYFGFQEDYEFWLRCCLLYGCTIHLIPKTCAMYRSHANQLTKTRKNDALKNSDVIRHKVISQLDPDNQKKYVSTLKKWKKRHYSTSVIIRRKIRDEVLRLLPEFASQKIISFYLKAKH